MNPFYPVLFKGSRLAVMLTLVLGTLYTSSVYAEEVVEQVADTVVAEEVTPVEESVELSAEMMACTDACIQKSNQCRQATADEQIRCLGLTGAEAPGADECNRLFEKDKLFCSEQVVLCQKVCEAQK